MENRKKIHVTMVGGGKFSTLGGIVRSIAEISNYMVEHGHSVKILANGEPGDKPFYDIHPAVEVEFMKYPFNVNRIKDFRAVLESQETDLFAFFFSNKMGLNVLAAAHGLDTPILRSEHGNPEHLIKYIWNENPELRDLTFQMADFSHVLLDSFSAYPSLPESVRSNISHIPSPIDLNVKIAKPMGRKNSLKRIIYCGRIETFEKDTQALFDAYMSIANDFDDWVLDFYGDGSLREELEAQIPEHLREKITFHGAVLPERLSSELSKSHIFVIPSKTEGCPMSLGEAMAHGLPSIGFQDCGGVKDMIIHGETGYLCEEGMTFRGEGLINYLKLLMSDGGLRKTMGQKALKEIQTFDSKIVLNDWEKILVQAASIGPNLNKFREGKRANYPDLNDLEARVSSTVSYIRKNKQLPPMPLSEPIQGINVGEESSIPWVEKTVAGDLPENHIFPPSTVVPYVPYVSVIITAYNMEKFIAKTVKSALNQSLKNIEIIIINDGSKDKTSAEISKLSKGDKRVSVINQKNAGVSAARNRGLKEAKGKYILFWDGDDILQYQALERLYVQGELNNSDIVVGTLYHFENDGKRKWVTQKYAYLKRTKEKQTDILLEHGLRYDVSTCNKIYRTEFIRECGLLFPVGLRLEDILFAWNAYLLTGNVCISGVEVGGYRKVRGSQKGSTLWGEQKVDSVIKVYNSLISLTSNEKREVAKELKTDIDIYFVYVLFYALKSVLKMDGRKTKVKNWRQGIHEILTGIDPVLMNYLPVEYNQFFEGFIENSDASEKSLKNYKLKKRDSFGRDVQFSTIRKIKMFDTLEFISKRLPRKQPSDNLGGYYSNQSLELMKYANEAVMKYK